MLLMWKLFRRLSCPAYVVHVSLPYSSVLTTQASYTAILGFTVSLGLVHTCVVRHVQGLWLPSRSVELCIQGEVVSDGGAKVGEPMDHIMLVVVDSDGWWCLSTLSQDASLFQANGQPKVSAGLGEMVHQ